MVQYLLDWIAPVGLTLLGLFSLDHSAYYITKEVVIGISVLLGILTNVIRLCKMRKKDDE